MMRKITLTPMPTVQFHLAWGSKPRRGPVGWTQGYYETADGALRAWPQVEQRYWKPSYWLLWVRIALTGPVMLRSIDPQTKRPYVASFDDQPTFTTADEMLTYANAKNGVTR